MLTYVKGRALLHDMGFRVLVTTLKQKTPGQHNTEETTHQAIEAQSIKAQPVTLVIACYVNGSTEHMSARTKVRTFQNTMSEFMSVGDKLEGRGYPGLSRGQTKAITK